MHKYSIAVCGYTRSHLSKGIWRAVIWKCLNSSLLNPGLEKIATDVEKQLQ